MNVRKSGLASGIFGPTFNVKQVPYVAILGETQLTVGSAALVNITLPTAAKVGLVTVRNVSASGQSIRIGNAPDFPTVKGMLLYPGDVALVEPVQGGNMPGGLNAIASAAGALLEVQSWQTLA